MGKIQLPNDKGEFWIEDGICFADLKGDHTLEDAKIFYKLLSENAKMPIPIYGVNERLHTVEREARIFYANDSEPYTNAVVIMINNPVAKILDFEHFGLISSLRINPGNLRHINIF